MGKAFSAIAHALKDVIFGRLTLLALVNLVLAGVITGSAAAGAITYLIQVIPDGRGWIGAMLNAGEIALSVATIVLALALSPPVSMLIGGLLFDFAAERVEKAIGAPPARPPTIMRGLANGVRIALPALLLNLLAIPLYFIPVVNAIVFYALNGYLMGREYSTLAATRRGLAFKEALKLRRSARASVFVVGLACSIVPFVGPLLAASAMTRLVHAIANRSG
jgi:CysZ protein